MLEGKLIMTKFLLIIVVLIVSLGGVAGQRSGDSQTKLRDTGVKDELKPPGKGGGGKAGGENRRKNNKQWLTIELFIVTDYTIYQKWMAYHRNDASKVEESIKHYYAHVVEGMNDIYARALDDQSYFIDLSINGIYIAKSKQDAIFIEDPSVKNSATDVSGGKVMVKLIEWMEERKKTINVPEFDLITLFTKYRMGDFNGLAFPGQVCLRYGVSINRDIHFFQAVETTTHEIGHNIASHHDGTGNTCNYFYQFIMAAGRTDAEMEMFKRNQYLFSKCSKKRFNDNIQEMNRKNKNCMTNKPRSKYRVDFSSYLGQPFGQKYSLDDQCRLYMGPSSYYCGTGLEGGICWSLVCYDPELGTCSESLGAKPATGTSCGDKKWCYRISCVKNDKAPKFKNKCPYGDFKGVVQMWNYSCKDKLKSHMGECYKEEVEMMCCKSCQDIKAGKKAGCEYGDRYEDCRVQQCREEGYKAGCCETCKNVFVAEKKRGCSDKDRDGECGLVRGWMCEDSTVKSKCCETCRKLQVNRDECKYGDISADCRYAVKDEAGFCSGGAKGLCCNSCLGGGKKG